MVSYYDYLVQTHPILTFFCYVVFCILLGISLFFSWSFIRKRIEIRKNKKLRLQNDKSR